MSEHAETLEDEVLGTFRVEPYPAEDGGTVYGLRCELDGQKVSLTFAAAGGEPVRRAPDVLREAVARRADLRREAAYAVVRALSGPEDGAPTAEELAEAAEDLVLQAFDAVGGGELVVHLSDSCGEHLLDGYWPAVRFGGDGRVAAVTIEA